MEAIEGNKDAALEALRRALWRAPSLREYLETDDDLVSLHEEPEFKALVAG
jgi:hypothetical protein